MEIKSDTPRLLSCQLPSVSTMTIAPFRNVTLQEQCGGGIQNQAIPKILKSYEWLLILGYAFLMVETRVAELKTEQCEKIDEEWPLAVEKWG